MPLQRQQLIHNISVALAVLKVSVQTLNKQRFFDVNIVAEDFFAELLNLVYGWQLVNLNHITLNQVAIDLGDHTNGVGVQVTSERRSTKIQKTLDKFAAAATPAAGNPSAGFPYSTLKVLIIGDRTGKYANVSVPTGVGFDPSKDIIGIDELVADATQLSTDKLESIDALIQREVTIHGAAAALQQQSDVDALKVYRDFFDRPALQDRWDAERNFVNFEKALEQLISLLTRGYVDGQPVTKRRSAFTDPSLRAQLNVVYRKLTDLARCFGTHKQSGEIDLERNQCHFHHPQTVSALNGLKTGVIDEMNRALAMHHLPPLPGVQ